MKINTCTFYISLLFCFKLAAQETLMPEDAVATALKNSYSILILQTQSTMANNNNTIGNAGFLPTVNLNASRNFSSNKTNQEYASGLVINQSGVKSSGLNAGINLNWTIFDGLKMFATKERLAELDAQGRIALKIEIENTVSKIIAAYYDVVRQQQYINAIQESIKIGEERMKVAQKKADIGSGSGQEVLQAKIDLNAQKSTLIKQKLNLDQSKINLNQLLNRPGDADFKATDSIVLNYHPTIDDLKKTLLSNNNQLQFAQKNISIAQKTVREINAVGLPQIALNTTYNFSQSKNQVGFVLLNQNLGLNAAITATWTIFNGFKNRTQIKNAKLNLFQNEQQYNLANTTIEASLYRAWKAFLNAQEVLKLEEENYLLVNENIKIALERFRLGTSSSIELMTAQKSFEDSRSRLVAARYDAKLAETELKRLNGELVK